MYKREGILKMKDFIVTYWLECGFGVALTGLSLCFRSLQKKLKRHEALEVGVLAMLHDRLFQSGMHFINKGEITVSELKNIEKMYEAYHNLGGNGTGTEVWDRVRELPLVK